MKKLCLIIIFIILYGFKVFSQTPIKRNFFSAKLKKQVELKIWLPENFKKTEKYPVIYEFGSGIDKYLATIADYYSGGYLADSPPSIVVGIKASTDDLGFSYDSGKLSKQGDLFQRFITNELFEFIEKNYSAAKFRTIAGHSYGADYANYYFKNQPQAFSGYILFAPEEPNYIEDLSPAIKAVKSPAYYFLAVAGKDEERRINFGKKLEKNFTEQQNPNIHFKTSTFAEAEHTTIIPQAIASALQHIYKDYKSYTETEKVADVLTYFKQTQARLLSLYGYPMRKDNPTAFYFMGLAAKNKDIKALNFLTDFFITTKSSGLDIFNFAQTHFQIGNHLKAKALYLQAINRATRQNQTDALFMAHRSLALNIYLKTEKNLEMAWATLEKGHLATKDVGMKFYQGKLAVENKFKLDEGIEALKLFNTNRNETFYSTFFSQSDVFLLIAKGYLAKGDRAKMREYAEKSVTENPENKEAKELLKNQ